MHHTAPQQQHQQTPQQQCDERRPWLAAELLCAAAALPELEPLEPALHAWLLRRCRLDGGDDSAGAAGAAAGDAQQQEQQEGAACVAGVLDALLRAAAAAVQGEEGVREVDLAITVGAFGCCFFVRRAVPHPPVSRLPSAPCKLPAGGQAPPAEGSDK